MKTFDLEGVDADRAYSLLAGVVIPRPIALVSTQDLQGRYNAAPFSFFNVLGSEPPIVGFAPGDRDDGTPKDTAKNIRETGVFVVNLVDEALAEKMNLTAASLPSSESEFQHAGLTAIPSLTIQAPRIAESPVQMECKEWGTLHIGANRLVIGLVTRLHVREDLLESGEHGDRVNPNAWNPIGRLMSPNWYAHTKDRFELVRPK